MNLFGTRISESVLITRLQSEVDYLRDQNKMLMDRLVSIIDQRAFTLIKQTERQDHVQKVAEIKAEKMTFLDLEQEKIRQKENEENQKILNFQLSSMRGEQC
jgi:hypothetical protein